MAPRLRRFVLTVHVVASVGWIGAVLAFIVLALVTLTDDEARTVHGTYLAMEPLARYLLVPLAFASLLSGAVQSLGTAWGLFRHYWVLFKLGITVLCTVVLLNYMAEFRAITEAAADPTAATSELRAFGASVLLHSALAFVALLMATILSIYKPTGVTWYGRRQLDEPRDAGATRAE